MKERGVFWGHILPILGQAAFAVGMISGIGEFLGYVLRLASGYLSDKTKAYWTITLFGYSLLFSLPLIGLFNNWKCIAFFIVLERIGKAIRAPARDAMLSHASKQAGRGWTFALHEAMDQIGAMTGPLIFSIVFFFKGNYRNGFYFLFIPAFFTLATLIAARFLYPNPLKFEEEKNPRSSERKLPVFFWYYALFVILSVSGFCHFQILSYHFKLQAVIMDAYLPLLYTLAMGVDGVMALFAGKTYDKKGLSTLIFVPILTFPIPWLAFSNNMILVILSVILWGSVMGIHETTLRAAIADFSSPENRGLAYGIFNTLYGTAWFIGSMLIGFFYEKSVLWIGLFVFMMEAAAIPAIYLTIKKVTLLQRRQ